MTTMLKEALDYAARGWYVFPCREKPSEPYMRNGETITPLEKQPYVSKGLNDASTDPDQIKAWWTKWPNAMIGINAGKSGLFVVDIDRKSINGLDTYTQWGINDGAGLHSITPSGGTHIVFTGNGKSSTNAKTGIDTRGEGGYFIAPPSKILEGTNVGEYKRFNDWGKTPGIIPDGLMAKLFPDSTISYVRGASATPSDGQKRQLSRNTLNFLANGAPEGERNSTLFKVLADFAGCGYTREHTKETVMPAALRIGLTRGEFEQVLEHAYSKPRSSSIPEAIQEKIAEGGKNLAAKITAEETTVIENALLACLIKDNAMIAIAQDIVSYEDFHSLNNRIIYKAINRMFNRGMKADYVTVSTEVAKETDKINLDEISKMLNQYSGDISSESLTTYCYIVREKSSIRKVEALMDNKTNYIHKGGLIDVIGSLEKDIADIALYGGAKSTSVLTSAQAVEEVKEHVRLMEAGEIEQLKTGFTDYDYHVGGIYSNELIVLAGRAGEGKSAMSLSILNDLAFRQNKRVAMFSLEMSNRESICRLITQMTGIQFKNVYQGKMTPEQWKQYNEALDKIGAAKLHFDDSFGITVPELRSKIRKLMEKEPDLVIIDQLEQIKGYEGQPAYIQFDKIAYDIKNMTKEFNVPIILNHQLNRGVTDRKLKNPEPQLSDLNQAGEKPANQVWVISHNKDDRGKILQSKVKVLKNRNGPRIEFAVIYVGERMLFSNPTREEDKYVFQYGDNHDEYEHYGADGNPDPDWARTEVVF